MAIVEEVMHGSSRIVDDLFKGSYAYVTRCLECQNQSETISTFTELDLQIAGMKFLQDCLTSYFKPEILDGDNQYFCQLCQRKVKATRQIQLKRLPPVLNIQLMRFIYDRSTGQKKKLSNIVQFPELLDLSEYLGLPRDQYVYELSAVLIHHGVSANSGHYYALIRENNTRRWFQYNDEKVTLQTGKVLKTELDKEAEQEFTSTPTTKKPRIEAGMQGSRGAYMLVYQLVKEGDGEIDAESPKLPADLETEVKETFAAIDCANEQLKAENTKIIAHVQQKREAVEKVFKELFVTADTELSQIDFVPKKTLETFLNPANSEKSSGGFLEPVDMKLFLCSHGKLDFRQLVSYKCVKRTGAQHLYDLFICDQPMTYADLCLSCVKYKCATLQLQKKAKSDAARITNLVKNFRADQVCEGFWVGKESLKNWKKMAERNLAQDYGVQITNGARSTEPAEDADVTIGEPSISPDLVENTDKKISETTEEPGENGSTENDVGDLRFNTDLLCCHGKLYSNNM